VKVLHVIDALGLGGGAEHALAQQLPVLAERGVESTVVCLRSRAAGGLADRIRSSGVEVRVLGGGLVRSTRLLRRLVDAEAPDVVHASLFDACLVSRLALLGRPVPLVNSIVNASYDPVRIRSLGRSTWKAQVVRLVDAVTIRRVDRLHALTGAVAADAGAALHLDAARFTVIPRGRPASVAPGASRDALRAELGAVEGAPVLLAVGRQDLQKDQLTLVRALGELRGDEPGAVLWLAGRPGTQTAAIEAAVDELGLRSRVRVLGHRDDVAALLAAADLFVLPSRYEGLGSVVIEAMCAGTAIVATEVPAVRETVGPAAAAFVAPGSPPALARAIASVLADEDRRAGAAAAGRCRFVEHFEIESVVERLVGLYQEAAASRPASRRLGRAPRRRRAVGEHPGGLS